MKFINTYQHHLQNPGISVEQYVQRKQIKLAQETRCAKKIYLDTKFWLLLRDARLGRPATVDVHNLLGMLETLVLQKKALCPLSVDIFAEVFKQSDPSTLRATVRLIDDLSMGVSIIELVQRLKLEVFHFIRETTKGQGAVHALDDLVWTKTPYVMGFVTPVNSNLNLEIDTAIQKGFIDQMWLVTLTDWLDQLGNDVGEGRKGWFSGDIAEQLNEGKFSHTHEYLSFKQLFLNELAGILDLHKPMFAELWAHIYESDTGKTITSEEAAQADAGRVMANAIYNAFRLDKIKAEFASFRVSAGLHAAVRWDPKRKYKTNDLHDIHHAVAAIPYCDFFLTEHSLRHLVGDKNLALSSFFKCKTISDASEAVSALSHLATA